jgi:glycosyltransferase involved in cell wall biosynthesis
MDATNGVVEVSVVVPARNEEANLANCLGSLVGQAGVSLELIVVDDHSTDHTRAIATGFPVRVVEADPLAPGWSGKCNACWTGARVAKGKWLLFTDADTRHTPRSIASGLREAEEYGAAMLSYSPGQEVHGFAGRALMPVIFAELAVRFRPKEVSDPASTAAAANGQYLLIRREAYDAIGGHAAVANAILEDVELARRVKAAGYRIQFRLSDVVSTRMYRSFAEMWEGWTKNLVLLFPNARGLALRRSIEFGLIAASVVGLANATLIEPNRLGLLLNGAIATVLLAFFYRRIRRAHFHLLSNSLAIFGLPLFSILLLRSYLAHKRGEVQWKGRTYAVDAALVAPANCRSLESSSACGGFLPRDDIA